MGEYIMWLGFNDIFSNSHPRRKGRSQTPIFPPKSSSDIWSVEAEPQELDHKFLSDWSRAFLALVDGNSTHLQNRTLDPARNAQLGAMLEQLNFRL